MSTAEDQQACLCRQGTTEDAACWVLVPCDQGGAGPPTIETTPDTIHDQVFSIENTLKGWAPKKQFPNCPASKVPEQ